MYEFICPAHMWGSEDTRKGQVSGFYYVGLRTPVNLYLADMTDQSLRSDGGIETQKRQAVSRGRKQTRELERGSRAQRCP